MRRGPEQSVAAGLARALKKQPARFITLLFDRKIKRHWDINECRDRFIKFRRWLERTYPDSWFIFVMEFSKRSETHYHLLGRFGQGISKKTVCEKWMKVTGTKWGKTAKIDPYLPEKHRSYVTTPRKPAGTHKLMKKLGQKSFWGCIHRKKMPLYCERQFTLTSGQVAIFFAVLGFLLHKQGCSKKDLRRLLKDKNCSGFCTPQMINEARDYALRLDEAWS